MGLAIRNPNLNFLSDIGWVPSSSSVVGAKPGTSVTRNGTKYTRNSDGTVTIGGTRTGDNAVAFLGPTTGGWRTGVVLPTGEYRFSWWTSASTGLRLLVWKYSVDGETFIGSTELKPSAQNSTSGDAIFTLTEPTRCAFGANSTSSLTQIANVDVGVVLTLSSVTPANFEPLYITPTKIVVGSTEIGKITAGDRRVF